MTAFNAKCIDAVVLCGGEGKRLKTVIDDRPKPMAQIGNQPFIDILVEYVSKFGFRRFILCAGYKAESIKEYYKNQKRKFDILITEEHQLLGTGGAVKNAQSLINTDPFLVLNGDSFLDIDLYDFGRFHLEKAPLLSIALISAGNTESYGSIKIDNSGRITEFCEKKKSSRAGMINGGVYLFDRQVFSLMPPENKFSLEYDFFPKMLNRKMYGYLTKGLFVDIGTPERYIRAKRLLKDYGDMKISERQ